MVLGVRSFGCFATLVTSNRCVLYDSENESFNNDASRGLGRRAAERFERFGASD